MSEAATSRPEHLVAEHIATGRSDWVISWMTGLPIQYVKQVRRQLLSAPKRGATPGPKAKMDPPVPKPEGDCDAEEGHGFDIADACAAHLADLKAHHPGGWPFLRLRAGIPVRHPPAVSMGYGSPAAMCADQGAAHRGPRSSAQ